MKFPLLPLLPLLPLRSLCWPLVVSLGLHTAVWLLATPQIVRRPLPRIDVHLPQLPDRLADALLKNTLKNGVGRKAAAYGGTGIGRRLEQVRPQQQRLAEHVFYPPQAVEQGLEGEVRLLLRLDAKGRLLDVRITSSSGYALLDEAALAAAHATGSFPGGAAELTLPVVFRLSE